MSLRSHSIPACINRLVFCLVLLTWALGSNPCLAEDPASAATSLAVSFPGLDELIPKASEVTTRLTEANAVVDQTESLEDTHKQLADLAGRLKTIEEQFTNWEDSTNWPLNRLMTAEARYKQIDREQKQRFEVLTGHFRALEDLRATWSKEKTFWQEWPASLRKNGIKIPGETFTKTRQGIDELLQRISLASIKLISMQKEFSAEQETLASRLGLIDKTLGELRQETFRRNAYSLFSMDFYLQLNGTMLTEYRDNFISTMKLPDGFWQRQGWIVLLQLICSFVLANILLLRRRKAKPISTEWRFFFKHPISGAIFIIIATTSSFYENPPPSWGWLILTIATITGTVLASSMAEKQRRKWLIRVLAVVYLVSETLKVSGLPTPAYQLYEVLLCAIAAPMCLLIARHTQRQEPDRTGVFVVSLYLISLFALIGLATALLGFATLSIHLIDAVLGTIIVLFIVRMTIRLVDGGITEFLRMNWIRERQFIRRLGISTGDRLKTLAHIIILVEAGLFLPVVWGVYNNVDEVSARLLSLEYSIGEFSISLYMVTMIIVVLYLTNLFSWLVQAMADAHYMTPRKMEYGVKTAMKRLLHYAMFTVGFLVAVSMAGLDLQKFTIIAGALGVGIGFGLQNIVNNFVSGLILLFERPVKVGDTINIDDQWGTVIKIGLRSTVFETLDRAEIIVPNSDLISQKVTNWTFTSNISRIVLQVGVAYGSPLDEVLKILLRVANEQPDILDSPEPSAIFTGFGESSIDFELRVWISDINKRLKIKSDLGQAVDRHFREHCITIPFPQRDLHLRSIESNLQSLQGTPTVNQSSKSEGTTE